MSSSTTTPVQPLTALITWGRHEAGYLPRDADEPLVQVELGHGREHALEAEIEAGQ
jgi:hypothetical protein